MAAAGVEAPCLDWPALAAAYQLASGQGRYDPPAGWERFSWLGGELPRIDGCEPYSLPELSVRAGAPWLALGGLAVLIVAGAWRSGSGQS